MTDETLPIPATIPGNVQKLMSDLLDTARYLKAFERIQSLDQALREAQQAHETQLQIVFEAKQNAAMWVHDAKNNADREVAKIEAETAEVQARFDDLNSRCESMYQAKLKLDDDIYQGQAKLDSIKAELARIAGTLG